MPCTAIAAVKDISRTMLRGIKCNICGEIGKHYSSVCPERVKVGVPISLRPEVSATAAIENTNPTPPQTGRGGGGGGTSTSIHHDADVYVDASQLTALIRKRPDIPEFLRCRACLALPQDAIWCQCCDIFVCHTCLGPPPDATWTCPECEECAVDNFHVIQAMRAVITAWFQSVAVLTDPYCVSSDEEDASEGKGNQPRKRIKL